MKKEEIKIAVIGSKDSPTVIADKVKILLAEAEVSASLDSPARILVIDDEVSLRKDVETLFILQKVEHVDPEILRRELRNDKPWKTQKWRKKLK